MPDLLKPVSGRVFAKMVGQSEGAVRKAKNRNSIVNGLTDDGQFIPQIAAAEWGKEILPEFLTDAPNPKPEKKTAAAKPPAKPVKKQAPKKPVRKPKAPAIPSFDEMADGIMNEEVPEPDDLELFDDDPGEEIPDGLSKPEAERQIAVLKAKTMRLVYAEKVGDMIPKAKIKTAAFLVGQSIRTSVEGITNRVLDHILAAPTRPEAKHILDEEIHNTLLQVMKNLEREI